MLVNRDAYYYLFAPCLDPNINLTDVLSTKNPLCNQTTTSVMVSAYTQISLNSAHSLNETSVFFLILNIILVSLIILHGKI